MNTVHKTYIKSIVVALILLGATNATAQTWQWPTNDGKSVDLRSYPPKLLKLPGLRQTHTSELFTPLIDDCEGNPVFYSGIKDTIGREYIFKDNANYIKYRRPEIWSNLILPADSPSANKSPFHLISTANGGFHTVLSTLELDSNKQVKSFNIRNGDDTLAINQTRDLGVLGAYQSFEYVRINEYEYWFLILDGFSQVRAYRLDKNGLSNTPVTSNLGINAQYYSHNSHWNTVLGNISVNHAQNKLVIGGVPNHPSNPYSCYMYDFDITTGMITSKKGLLGFKSPNSTYSTTNFCISGVQFAPCDSLLYLVASPYNAYTDAYRTGQIYPNRQVYFSYIFQMNLNTNAVHEVKAISTYKQANSYTVPHYRHIKLGPDGKMYLTYKNEIPSIWGSSIFSLSAIHHPNREYPHCGLQEHILDSVYMLSFPRRHAEPPQHEFTSPQESIYCVDSVSFHIKLGNVFSSSRIFFGDGDSAILPSYQALDTTIYHSYLSSGTYSVSLKSNSAECGHSYTYNDDITWYSKPIITRDLTQTTQILGCDTTRLIIADSLVNTTMWSHNWVADDSLISISSDSTYTLSFDFGKEDTVYLSTSAENAHCIATQLDTFYITILPKPVSHIFIHSEASKTIADTLFYCLNNDITLVDSTNQLRSSFVSWNSEGTSLFSDSIKLQSGENYRFSSIGGKRITVTDTNLYGCYATDTLYVRVVSLPNTSVSVNNAEQCINDQNVEWTFPSKQYSAFDSIAYYKVNYGNGVRDSLGPDTKLDSQQYTTAGTYTYWFIPYSTMGCIDTGFSTVVINAAPLPLFVLSDSAICQGEAVRLSNFTSISSGTIDSFHLDWSVSERGYSFIYSADQSYPLAGKYPVTLTAFSDKMCASSLASTLNVHPRPKALFSEKNNKNEQCFIDNLFEFKNSSTILSGSIDTSIWSFGDGTSEILQAPNALDDVTKSYTVENMYQVELIVASDQNCTDTATRKAVAHPNPTNILSTSDVCQGDSSIFNTSSSLSSGTITTQILILGDGTSVALSNNPEETKHTYSSSGDYAIQYISVSDQMCADTTGLSHRVAELPIADFDYTILGTDGIEVRVEFVSDSRGDISELEWNLGDGSIRFDETFFEHLYADTGLHKVELLVSNSSGCSDSLLKNLLIYPKPLLWIPSAFTPNGDGLNDVFKPFFNRALYSDLSIQIYNRWGEKVADLDGLSSAWDGREAPPGVYLYTIQIRDIYNKTEYLKGSFSLIK